MAARMTSTIRAVISGLSFMWSTSDSGLALSPNPSPLRSSHSVESRGKTSFKSPTSSLSSSASITSHEPSPSVSMGTEVLDRGSV